MKNKKEVVVTREKDGKRFGFRYESNGGRVEWRAYQISKSGDWIPLFLGGGMLDRLKEYTLRRAAL